MHTKILLWFATGETGMSSKAMACCIAGMKGGQPHPYDPADFNRCLLFLKAVPEAREHLLLCRDLSPTWERLIDHWSELESMFLEEVGLGWEKGRHLHAKKTYDRMKQILRGDQ